MRVLVTGASGFIAKRFINSILDDTKIQYVVGIGRHDPLITHSKFKFIGCSLHNADFVREVMKNHQPNYIFHLSANPLTKLSSDPYYMIDDNIKATHILLHFLPDDCKFIYMSSATVYGDQAIHGDCVEDMYLNPTSVYGITKWCSEKLINCYQYKNYVVLRPVAVVGGGAKHGILLDFVKKLISDSLNLEVIGTLPGAIKPFLYVDDIVSAMCLLGFNNYYGVYNVSSCGKLNVEQIADLAIEITKIRKNIVWKSNTWAGDNLVVGVNCEKLLQLGWTPSYNTSVSAVKRALEEIFLEYNITGR